MKIKQLIPKALSLPNDAIFYHVSQELAAIYPKKALLESDDSWFNLEKYAEANLCKIKYDAHIHNQTLTGWNGMENQIYKYTENASFEVSWQENKLDVLLMSWHQGNCKTRYVWILANSTEIAQDFFAAVCDWNSQIRDEVLVFEDG